MGYRSINLKKLKPFDAPGIFTRISPEVEKEISDYPELHERIKSCASFCHQLGMKYPDDRDINERRKYIRAALVEFVSLEDAVKIDNVNENIKGKCKLSVLSLDDARLHVIRLLRHANVHLAACKINDTSRPATWDGPDGTVEFDYRVFYIPNIRESISSTNQSEKYSPGDLNMMIKWIDNKQMEWGIGHLVLKSAELCAMEFLKKCAQQKQLRGTNLRGA